MTDIATLLQQEFWIALREEIGFKGIIGRGCCRTWAYEAKKHLDEHHKPHPFEIFEIHSSASEELTKTQLFWHTWLEAILDHKLYIADGTAGQLDKNFPQGFYGWLHNAPTQLQKVYRPDKNETVNANEQKHYSA